MALMSVKMNIVVSKTINAAHAGVALSKLMVEKPPSHPNNGCILSGIGITASDILSSKDTHSEFGWSEFE